MVLNTHLHLRSNAPEGYGLRAVVRMSRTLRSCEFYRSPALPRVNTNVHARAECPRRPRAVPPALVPDPRRCVPRADRRKSCSRDPSVHQVPASQQELYQPLRFSLAGYEIYALSPTRTQPFAQGGLPIDKGLLGCAGASLEQKGGLTILIENDFQFHL